MKNLENYDWNNPNPIENEEKGLESLMNDIDRTGKKYRIEFTAKNSDIQIELGKIQKIYDEGISDEAIYDILGNIYDFAIERIMQTEGNERMKNYRRSVMINNLLAKFNNLGIDDKNITCIKNIVSYIIKK